MTSLNFEVLGNRIKTLRKSQNLTLDILAQQSGISKGYLSRIENAQNDSSFSVLLKIARALSVPIGILLDEDNDPSPYIIDRSADYKRHIFKDGTCEYTHWAIATSILYKKMEPQLVEVPFENVEIYKQNDERFAYVLEGRVQVLDGQILEKGDSVYIMPNTPIRGKSIGETKARILFIICP